MSEDKKNQKKVRNDSKEQRKPRQRHHVANQPVSVEKKTESKMETKVPAKAVLVEPGPEFYKNLKRETDEILKITEEATTKYKKKEIQSNWSKYEIPVQTYEEIEEQENLGADFEKLIDAPHSVGGHFQFKHEKSWDTNTAPSLYDKYFNIDMETLFVALQTIPFYERNEISLTTFTDSDVLSMNNRSTKFKQKYYKNKSYTNTELQMQEKILQKLKDDENSSNDASHAPTVALSNHSEYNNKQKNVSAKENKTTISGHESEHFSQNTCNNTVENITKMELKTNDNLLAETKEDPTEVCMPCKSETLNIDEERQYDQFLKQSVNNESKDFIESKQNVDESVFKNLLKSDTSILPTKTKNRNDEITEVNIEKKPKEPLIESPEDLEKWLDDFLDS